MKKRENMKDSTLKHFNPMKLREKYSVNKKNNYSSFWLDNDWDNRKTSIFDEEDTNVKPKKDLVALAGYRRAISNFVTIVTGESDIKVNFNSNDESYTDGKVVTIGAKLDDKLFDPSVGLALHEGSHIKLSDFQWLKNLEFEIPQETFDLGYKKGYSRYEVLSHVKNFLNYVEDRRIDNYVFKTSPGYKGYYHSMYEKYFYSKVVDKALLSSEYTEETLDSYMFRVINLTNKNTRLDSLVGLRKIWNLIDVKNIERLETTQDAFKVAHEVYTTILHQLVDGTEKTNSHGDKEPEPGKPGDEGKSSESGNSSKQMSDEDFDRFKEAMSSGDVSRGHSNGSDVELTANQKKQLEKLFEKQKDFVSGNIKKVGKLSKKESQSIKAIEDSGMTYEEVGKDLAWSKGTKCLVVRKLTKSLIENSGNYEEGLSVLSPYRYSRYGSTDDEQVTGYVEDGIRLGTVLGKKLQVRGESRETKYTRLDSGRIDKRLIAELGFGNDRVFNTSYTESYSDAFLHISVDASGSMSGEKWTNTMTSVVAICKAASMIQNVDVVVSIRSTHTTGSKWGRGGECVPLIVIAYDSRVDKFSKVKNMFAHIRVAGTTPEGLCYEAVMDEIIPSTNERDSYFLNFSDGMPMFSNGECFYNGFTAVSHTAKTIKEMRSKGIKVLSYFIGDSEYERESSKTDFKTMYGKDAEFIDVTSVMSISKTMNKRFLTK